MLFIVAVACTTPPVAEPPAQVAPAAIPAREPRPAAEPEPPPLDPARLRNRPPDGWVDLTAVIPSLALDIRYHTVDNFTGAPLPGYAVPGAWLQQAPAEALAAVQADLAPTGLGLLVYDAYRPLRGTLGMVAWAKRTDQVHLLDDGYIARRSGHNKGNTVDLTLVDLATGRAIDMGTPWDTLDERSHTRNATGPALDNRMKLVAAMRAHGWRNYSKEWWHFTFAMEGDLRHRDVPYACFEAEEGAWQAPAGWADSSHVMPAVIPLRPCPADDATPP